MRHLAITGMVTAPMIDLMSWGSDMRATPPSLRMSAGTRSSAITAQAPASSATFACSGVTTSMMTPPFNISACPDLTLKVPLTAPFPVLSVITAEFYAWTFLRSDQFGPLPAGQCVNGRWLLQSTVGCCEGPGSQAVGGHLGPVAALGHRAPAPSVTP